jgi:oligopeptide transport system ATP-binding protein
MALLEVDDLRTHFYTQDGIVKAVDGVTLHINEGETLGIVGESGSGKSVTALTMMRLIPQPPGKVVGGTIGFDGRDLLKVSDEEMRRIRGKEIGMIFQDPMTSLNPVLTIGRQMTEAIELHLRLSGGKARDRAVEYLNLVGIPNARERLGQYPHQLSGGQRQRVMIAMALSCNPKLLIADEPTTALDVTIQAQILELIKNLQKELGMAVMVITHALGVVAGMADRVNVMYAGHVYETADVDELFGNPRNPYTLGLLKSIPRLDEERKTKLDPIRGLPPDLINPGQGCPFVPRCDYAVDVCAQQFPPFREVVPHHKTLCWVDVKREGAAG